MSKVIAAMAATGGVATVAVGGSYLVKNGLGEGTGAASSDLQSVDTEKRTVTPSSNTEADSNPKPASNPTQSQPQPQSPDSKLKFKTLDEFKNKHGYKCSTSMFSGKDVDMSNLSGIGDLTSANDFLGSPATDKSHLKSCLTISWEKNTYTSPENKWSGTFTWTWSFENENKGFVIANIAKAEAAGKLKLIGGAYLIEKESTGETWKVKHKSEPTDEKELTEKDFDEKFPKVKSDSGVTYEKSTNPNYWGFMKDKDDLKNICDTHSCPKGTVTPTFESEEFKWSWATDGDKKIFEWSEKLEWWDYIYGNSSFNLGNKLDAFKGTWTKVTQASQ